MAFTLDPQTGKITFGVVSDGTHDGIAIDLASQFGVSEDFNDNYSSDNWTDIGTGFGVNVPSEVMNVRGVKGGTNNGSGFDLGAGNVSDTNFVLRFKFEFTSLPTIVTDDSALYLSIDSIDQSTGANTVGHDALTLQIAKSASSQLTRLVPFSSNGGAVVENSLTALLADGVGPIYYIEIKRTSTTSATWTLFSDSTYTTVIATSTNAIPVGITGLRHIVWRSRSDGSVGAGELTAEIDDVQFWNAKSIPIIEATTNWRIRYKLDITNLADGANITDKQLYMGLFDEDGISGSDNAQDGYALLLSHDNTVSQFRVITPDNQAPRLATADAIFTTTPSIITRFIELRRDSMSQTTTSIFSDATFTTLVESEVVAGVSGSDNLKYLKFMNDVGSNATGAIDGTIDDITFTVGVPPLTEIFLVDAILATIAFGNDLTWSFREHDSSNLFNVDYDYLVGGSPPSFITRSGVPSSIGTSHLFKVFKKSEITGSDIRVTWSNPQGGSNRIEVADGAYDPSSLIDFPSNSGRILKGGGILGTSISYTLTPFVTTVLPAGSINYAGSTEEFLTVFVNISDTQTGTQAEYVVRDVEVSLRGKWQFDNTPVITQVLIGTQQDFGYLNASSVASPPPTKDFTIDSILATIKEGNDLTWQYREHRTNATFAPSMTWTDITGSLRMLTTGASVGLAYTLKVFKLSEITGSDIKVTWERTLGNSGQGQIAVYDGTINAESLVDIPDLGSIPNTLLGFFNSSSFFPQQTQTLLASNIDYAGATGTHVTVVIRNSDGNATSTMALDIFDIEVTLRGTWDFSGVLVITDVRGTQQIGAIDVDDFGYINASSVIPPPVTKQFTINATLIARTCSPWKKFSEADGSSLRVTINAGDAQGYEIPPVTVPTQVTGIKCSVKSVSTQGSVKMRIADFPQSQLVNGNFATIPNGTSTNQVLMIALSGSFTDFTFLFSGAVLEPNKRYMIIFDDLINNAPGMDYETILTSTKDYKEYAITYQDPGSGTPAKFARVIIRDRAPAVDIEVANEGGLVCPLVDALLVAEDSWEFREQRFSNANLIKAPNFTLGTEPPRLQVSAPTNSDGRGWIFKSFKKSDITGNSILVEGDGLQETRLRVYDGEYKRQYFGDFEPAGSINDPVTPLDGIGLLGSTSANPLTTSLLLPAGSINYAGSTEDIITVMISCRQNFDASVAELNISAITMSPFLKWNFSNPIVVTEETGFGGETDFGFTRASSTQVPFMETEFTIDACLGLFTLRRSIIGDLIIKVLQANPSGLTGLQIVTEVILFRPTAKTSRIKNWIGFLDTRGVIQDDGSNPDWYKTVWTLV